MFSKKVQVTVDTWKKVPVELGKIGNPPEGYEVKRAPCFQQTKVEISW